jgi:hypothetical protein
MAGQKLWTAEELKKLTPDQRAALVRERMIIDLAAADPDLVARARANGRQLLEERGLLNPG